MAVDIELADAPRLGSPRALFERPSLYSGRYDVSRDGQRFVMIDEGDDEPPPRTLHLVQHWGEELSRLVPTEP